ncbi:MAG TPA: ribonuclease R [Acidobacteria bacterium]|nr:ribonuclease R [Acidobacteriota bacterium]
MLRLPGIEKIESLLADGEMLTARELADRLGLAPEQRPLLRRRLQKWVAEGSLVMARGRRFGAVRDLGQVVGRLTRLPAGYGFVAPDDPQKKDLFIPAHAQADALHGDLVAAQIVEIQPDGRQAGRILRVVERHSRSLVGLLQRTYSGAALVDPLDSGFGFEVLIPAQKTAGAQSGELVRVEIQRFAEPGQPATGAVVERLGRPDDPGVEVEVLIRKYGLDPAFPSEVIAEVEALPGGIEGWSLEGRTDFRDKIAVTVDGASAKDFDDAICVERRGESTWLHVFIADVDAFVPEGSATDVEALRRGTSVYFPGRAVPMLPERLSCELCSLRPGVPRLTQGVSLEFDGEGRRVATRFHQGVIESRARLTYEQVAALAQGGREALPGVDQDVLAMLERALALAGEMERARARRGAVDFDLPEPEILMDLEGATVGIEARGRNPAHRMIEEFMIAANEAVAEHLLEKREAVLYRVHEKPPLDRLQRLAEALDGLGYSFSCGRKGQIEPARLQQIVAASEGRPEHPLVQRLVLRAMALARYDPACLGHFGLALERYLHFTSPIRRYPDLLVHRALRRVLGGRPGSGGQRAEREARMPELAVECSRLEREAEAAEREAIAWKMAAFMADRLGEEFDGTVVEVAPHGVHVLLGEPYVEGMIPIARLGQEYFRYDAARRRLVGQDSGTVYRLGQPIRVRVDRVDLLRHLVDFAPARLEAAPRPPRAGSRKRPGRGGRRRSPRPKGRRR